MHTSTKKTVPSPLCQEVREQLRQGGLTGHPQLRAHLAQCPDCSLFVAAREQVEDATGATRDELGAQALWGHVDERVKQDSGARAWLRSRPTWLRLGVWLAMCAAVAIAVVSAMPRHDLGELPVGGWVLLAAFASGLVLSASMALRPMYKPPAPRGLVGLAVAVAVGAPAALVWARPRWVGPIPVSGACLALGSAVAAATVGLGWLLLRNQDCPLAQRLLLAGTGGLAANLVLQLHCSATSARHLLLEHAAIAALLVAAAAFSSLRQAAPSS